MKRLITPAITMMFVAYTLSLLLPAFGGTWRDDFEDNKISEWEIYNEHKQEEKWWIDDGEAVGEIFSPGFLSLWLTGDLKWEQYSVSCRAMLEDSKNSPPTVGLTLYDRGDERSNYFFLIDYELNLAVINNTKVGSIARFDYVAEEGVWYELTATVYGDGRLDFTINDSMFSVVDLNPLAGGKAGLVVGDARARFDDFAVTGDSIRDGGPFDVEPRAKLATIWGSLKIKR